MTPTIDDALISALRLGAHEVIAAALSDNPHLHLAADADGMTLLHHAVAGEQLAMIDELLAFPTVPLEARQASHGRTPLHLAAIKGLTTLIRPLLDAGADVFALDARELRPLDVAGSPAAIAVLRPPTFHPEQALQAAIRGGAIARLTRQLRARPDLRIAVDAQGCSPLHRAVVTGSVPVVQAVLAAGVPVNGTERTGRTPLHLAVTHGHLSLIEPLLAAGADANRADYQGITPLHLAAGHGDATRSLLTLPPDALLSSEPAAPPLVDADQCAFDFAAPTPPPAPVAPTRAGDDLAGARALLHAGADVNARARGGVTPLHLAVEVGDAALVALLLRWGAARDAELAHALITPLQLATARGHVDLVTLLTD